MHVSTLRHASMNSSKSIIPSLFRSNFYSQTSRKSSPRDGMANLEVLKWAPRRCARRVRRRGLIGPRRASDGVSAGAGRLGQWRRLLTRRWRAAHWASHRAWCVRRRPRRTARTPSWASPRATRERVSKDPTRIANRAAKRTGTDTDYPVNNRLVKKIFLNNVLWKCFSIQAPCQKLCGNVEATPETIWNLHYLSMQKPNHFKWNLWKFIWNYSSWWDLKAVIPDLRVIGFNPSKGINYKNLQF